MVLGIPILHVEGQLLLTHLLALALERYFDCHGGLGGD